MKTSCDKCGSSDGVEIYEDHTYCFVCNNYEKKDDICMAPDGHMDIPSSARMGSVFTADVSAIADYPSYPMGSRKISRDVVDHFNVRMSVDTDGKPEAHYYPYTKRGKITAYKLSLIHISEPTRPY